VKTPWGLISAQYDLYTTGGRKLLGGCAKAAGGGSDLLARAARTLRQALPANSSLPANVDADLTKTRERCCVVLGGGAPGQPVHVLGGRLRGLWVSEQHSGRHLPAHPGPPAPPPPVRSHQDRRPQHLQPPD
jgi:hypothetical protein